MKIYVVLPCYSYEGYAEPTAAFSSLSGAEAHAAEVKRGDWMDVFEITVDEPATPAIEVATNYTRRP